MDKQDEQPVEINWDEAKKLAGYCIIAYIVIYTTLTSLWWILRAIMTGNVIGIIILFGLSCGVGWGMYNTEKKK